MSDFFTLGRVFAVVWSEPLSESGSQSRPHSRNSTPGLPRISNDGFGTQMYSQKRRMIVVRCKRGCSWAVPICSYRHQGCFKPGIEVTAHAIAYMQGTQAQLLRRTENDGIQLRESIEPASGMNPIEIIPANSYQRLSTSSRINFSKVQTIEHMVKVQDIGVVSPRSLNDLLQYFEQQCRLPREENVEHYLAAPANRPLFATY
jgi:hypothetical protein